jgi:PKD repeat protein
MTMQDLAACQARRPSGKGERRVRRCASGQSLVEFALVLPVMLLVLLVAIDFGRLFFSWIQVNNAAREGAAYGAAYPTDASGITTHASQETNAQAQAGESPLTVLVSCANQVGNSIPCSAAAGGAGTGNTLTVTVRETFAFLTPGITTILGGNLTIGAAATATVLGAAASASSAPSDECPFPSASFTLVPEGELGIYVNPSASQPDSGICAISGYNWDFGDGGTAVGTAVGTHYTYAAPGQYAVQLTVTNQAGESTVTQLVTVPPPTPSPSPTPAPTPTPAPPATPPPTPSPSPTPPPCTVPIASFTYTNSFKTYYFTDTSTVADPANCPIMEWLWDFGDGQISNAPNPVHTYGSADDHTVILKVRNAAGWSAPYSHTQ